MASEVAGQSEILRPQRGLMHLAVRVALVMFVFACVVILWFPIIGALAALGSLLVAAYNQWLIFTMPTLTLGPAGLSIVRWGRTGVVPWGLVTQVWAPPPRDGRLPVVALRLASNLGPVAGLRRYPRPAFRYDALLPVVYGLSADEMAARLDAWRTRVADGGLSSPGPPM